MKRIKLLLRIFISLFICHLLLSCAGPSFQVVDRGGLEIAVKEIKLEKHSHLLVLDGESIREVSLKHVKKLTLDASKFFSRNNRVYYQAVLVLTDGSQIKPRKGRLGEARSFVAVDDIILGKSEAGPVRVLLEDVNTMKQIMPETATPTQ